MEGFLRYRFGGLIFGGAYTRRGLFLEFYGIFSASSLVVILTTLDTLTLAVLLIHSKCGCTLFVELYGRQVMWALPRIFRLF